MFQFPPFAPFRRLGCPIRKSADHRIFAPTRGLSQLITSFFASVSQGIRHAPFTTFSPILTRCVSTRSGKLILSAVGFKNYRLNFYSLACVNMSKNSEKRPAVPDSGLTSSILFSLCGE